MNRPLSPLAARADRRAPIAPPPRPGRTCRPYHECSGPEARLRTLAAACGVDLGAVHDIPVRLSAVLGRTTMPVSQLLRALAAALDRNVGEAIDLLLNNRLLARGEVVILGDRLGVGRRGSFLALPPQADRGDF